MLRDPLLRIFKDAVGAFPDGTTTERLPEIDAVGIPAPVLLMNANFAVPVAVLPSKRSSVIFKGAILPLFLCQKLIELVESHAGRPL